MRKSDMLIVGALMSAAIGFWAAMNHPVTLPNVNGQLQGVSFQPVRDTSPIDGEPIPAADIEHDVRLLRGKVKTLRTYAASGGLERVPDIAARYGMKVSVGAWIGPDAKANRREVEAAIRLANRSSNVRSIIVGNEALLRGEVSVKELAGYMAEVRRRTKVPVSTAEPWHIWLKHPTELGQVADFIAIHVLPYWEGLSVDVAIDHVRRMHDAVKAQFPKKEVLLTEVGWPSDGRNRQDAVASRVNQARFVREFLALAQQQNWRYFVMEAFDQPWKIALEGGVGAYWGLYDADRHPKFHLTGPVVETPSWWIYALLSTVAALPAMLLFLARAQHVGTAGRALYAALIQGAALFLAWAVSVAAARYFTAQDTAVWAVLGIGLVLLIGLLLSEAYEFVEVLFARHRLRPFVPLQPRDDRAWPKVALHLPICNEPAAMVKLTLDSLARLDYPSLQVVVIDNNTKDPAVWRPVEAHVQALAARAAGTGKSFTFIHVDRCPGYKAGALNLALKATDADAAVIGVVDSDYEVTPDWLKATIPYFDDAQVGFVQAPQDHRDGRDSLFKAMINWEYAGFFNIGMVQRNERNAIIQHGTMTLIRRTALESTGRWAEWCITEDAELGLRLMEQGYESVYLNHCFGKGLTPDSYLGYKRQRYRWAYGAMMILKHHWRAMLPGSLAARGTALTAGQKFHFVAGWLPWIGDGLFLLLIGAALLWTVGALLFPFTFDYPSLMFVLPSLAFVAFKIVHGFAMYAARVPCGLRDRLGAMVAGLALTYAIGRATIAGLTTSSLPFHRTPKMEGKAAILKGLVAARDEAILGALLLAGAAAVLAVHGREGIEPRFWALALALQALPFLAAVGLSMASALQAVALPQLAGMRAGIARLLPARRPRAAGVAPVGAPAEVEAPKAA
ncbi:MAG: glycosyltransferase [Alphaproteobacteria bacterium]|nr:glycosyltransferase [Alphaproteobacteria bacterium]